jgi:hypothetical protein
MRTLALMRDRVYRDDTFAASFGSTVPPILVRWSSTSSRSIALNTRRRRTSRGHRANFVLSRCRCGGDLFGQNRNQKILAIFDNTIPVAPSSALSMEFCHAGIVI